MHASFVLFVLYLVYARMSCCCKVVALGGLKHGGCMLQMQSTSDGCCPPTSIEVVKKFRGSTRFFLLV